MAADRSSGRRHGSRRNQDAGGDRRPMTEWRLSRQRLDVGAVRGDIARRVPQVKRARVASPRKPADIIVMLLCRASRLVTMLAIGVMPGVYRHHVGAAMVPWLRADQRVASDEAHRGRAAAQPGTPLRVQSIVFALRPVPDMATGTATMEHRPYVLFADGRVREAFEDDPSRLDSANVARLAAQRADQWGRWQRGARGLLIDWNNGARDRISEPVDASPAVSDSRLAGVYVERDSTFRTRGAQPGGSVLRFFADGRFERTPVLRSGGTAVRARERGRYRVARWALTLTHDDGRREQKLFYRFPAGSGMIGFGRASFMRDTTKGRRP